MSRPDRINVSRPNVLLDYISLLVAVSALLINALTYMQNNPVFIKLDHIHLTPSIDPTKEFARVKGIRSGSTSMRLGSGP